MLKVSQIKLKNNMVLIDMEIPQVSDTVNGIHKSEEQKELEARQMEHRVGTIITHGTIDKTLLTSILGGDLANPVGKVVLFSAMALDPFRIPVEGHEKSLLVLINFEYLLGEIVDEE